MQQQELIQVARVTAPRGTAIVMGPFTGSTVAAVNLVPVGKAYDNPRGDKVQLFLNDESGVSNTVQITLSGLSQIV